MKYCAAILCVLWGIIWLISDFLLMGTDPSSREISRGSKEPGGVSYVVFTSSGTIWIARDLNVPRMTTFAGPWTPIRSLTRRSANLGPFHLWFGSESWYSGAHQRRMVGIDAGALVCVLLSPFPPFLLWWFWLGKRTTTRGFDVAITAREGEGSGSDEGPAIDP